MNQKCDENKDAAAGQSVSDEESKCGCSADVEDKKPEEITIDEWTSGGNCND